MCHHERTIDDVRNGCEVCENCGLVVNDQMFGDQMFMAPPLAMVESPASVEAQPLSVTCSLTNEFLIRMELFDALAVVHMDTSFMIDHIMNNIIRYAELESTPMHVREKLRTLNVKSKGNRGLLAFITWNTLNQHECPRPPQEIAHLLQTTLPEMQQAERDLNLQPTYCLPSSYVPRICSELQLPYVVTRTVVKAVATQDHSMCKPESIIGGVLLQLKAKFARLWHDQLAFDLKSDEGCRVARPSSTFLRQQRSIGRAGRLMALSTKQIAGVLNVSVSSLNNMKHSLTDMCMTLLENEAWDLVYCH